MPIIDIVLPYYGDVPQMQQAVRSVIDQTDDRWTLTVVDDGREPGVPEWFASLGHPRVRYERNERNLGITANFQKCLDMATQDHMVIFGCDDVMLPNYVETINRTLDRFPDAAIIQPGVQIIDGAGAPVSTLVDRAKTRIRAQKPGAQVRGGEELAVSLLHGNWMYFPSLCWKTKEIQAIGFDQRLLVIQDLDVILRMLERGAQVIVSDELCFQYRRHAVSVSSARAVQGTRFLEQEMFFAETAERLEKRGWQKAAKAARWHISSRLHALTMLPTAAKARNAEGVKVLSRHFFKN